MNVAFAFSVPVTFEYDPNGNTLSQQAVVAPAPPVIVTQPQDALLQPGGTVRFSVVAGGPGPVTYQWKHNGADLPGATGDVLVVSGLPINLPDYGPYTVVLSNGPGSTTTSAPATVIPDSNSNGIPDAWELQYFTTLSATADHDPDGDGMSSYDEYIHGSNPNQFAYFLTGPQSWYPQGYELKNTWTYRLLPGEAFQFQATATGNPTSYSASGLPPGLTLNTSSGFLSGASQTTGFKTVQLSAATNHGQAGGTLTLKIPSVFGTGSYDPPDGVEHVRAISAGRAYVQVLHHDGTVSGYGAQSIGPQPLGLADVVAISAGDHHTLALKSDGTVVAWGNSDQDGETIVPVGLSGVVAVAAGSYHNLALKNDGTVVGWGNSAGTAPNGLTNVVAIAAGDYHSLALLATGEVTAWDRYGEVTVPANVMNVVAIDAGSGHSLALKTDGTVVAWGDDTYDQASVPGSLTGVVAISAGEEHSVALRATGSVSTWGRNNLGQRNLPSGTGTLISVDAGAYFTTVLSTMGDVLEPEIIAERFAVGVAQFPVYIRVPVKNHPTAYAATGLPDGLTMNATTGLITGSTALTGTFEVELSATNAHGTDTADLTLTINAPEVSITSVTSLSLTTPTSPISYQITSNYPASSYDATGLPAGVTLNPTSGLISGVPQVTGIFVVTVSATTAYGVASDTLTINIKSVFGWGATSIGANYSQASIPSSLTGVRALAGGGRHSIALKNDGTVAGWGRNDEGQRTIPAGLNNVVGIACGDSSSLALKLDRTVASWGVSNNGSASPPGGLNTAVGLAAGQHHYLALKADGTVVAWGGNNTSGQRTVPPGLREVVAVAAGGNTSYALKADGTLIGWGGNSSGTPAGLANVVAVSCGNGHTVALKADGTVVAWGINTSGQATVPPGLDSVVAISAGNTHCLALKADGTLVSWGDNSNGQRNLPAELGTLAAMAGGGFHSLALSAKGNVTTPEIIAPRFAIGMPIYPFHFRVPAKNTPATFEATGLPDGLTIHPDTGVITGTPAMAGTYNVVLSATNAHGTGEADLTIYVNNPIPIITSATALTVLTGDAVSYQITSNLPVSAYAASGLPAGLDADTVTGVISGTPTTAGVFTVNLSATTAYGLANATLTLAVRIPFGTALDAPSLTWTSTSGVPWFGQAATTYDGVDAAQSGATGHSSSTWLDTTVTGPGSLSFWWKVSSQGNADYLEFRIDNVLQTGRISGNVNWQQQTHAIPEGTHALRWRYAKDSSGSVASDTGWLDEVFWIREGSFDDWLTGHPSLDTPEKRHPLANPAGDGINNLLKYAFNLDPALPISGGARTLSPGTGTSGLPFADTSGSGANTKLRIEFLRRRIGGAVYEAQFSSALDEPSWLNASGIPVVTIINDDWERVVIEDSVDAGTSSQRFGRLRVIQGN